ncbi:MAG: EutN/CcmL family microcompartment protein [Verrucomicrobiota bacterium]|nr:EutN/CcmL family microcompartment protein [Verrucomicrobiota bacterium]
MRLGRVIGRVTLNRYEPTYKAGRFLLVLPYVPPQGQHEAPASPTTVPLPAGSSMVVYDNLGSAAGDVIAYSESGEAAAAFAEDTPVDAFNCAIVDHTFYHPLIQGSV